MSIFQIFVLYLRIYFSTFYFHFLHLNTLYFRLFAFSNLHEYRHDVKDETTQTVKVKCEENRLQSDRDTRKNYQQG